MPFGVGHNAGENIPAIYLEDPGEEAQWQRLHLRGVDELSTQNIEVYASDYYADETPRVQWIDDTSANLVYSNATHSAAAIVSLCANTTTVEEIQLRPFELRTAKPMATHPSCMLTVRIAKAQDKKVKGARHASRYYLLHPEADPEERQRREKSSGRPRRTDDGEYTRNKFDEREHTRRRKFEDENGSTNDFAASMYDEAPTTGANGDRGRDLFSRITKGRRRSASPATNGDAIPMSDSDDERPRPRRYRNRDPPPSRKGDNAGRELFSDSTTDRHGGMRSENPDNFVKKALSQPRAEADGPRYHANAVAARQFRADMRAAQSQSPINSHRRSRAMDTRVEEDLIERFGRKSISMDSTKSVMQTTANSGKELFDGDDEMNGGLNIRGSANQGMSIKGRAENVRELFPGRYSEDHSKRGHARKELFDEKVRTRAPKKQAFDLFD